MTFCGLDTSRQRESMDTQPKEWRQVITIRGTDKEAADHSKAVTEFLRARGQEPDTRTLDVALFNLLTTPPPPMPTSKLAPYAGPSNHNRHTSTP